MPKAGPSSRDILNRTVQPEGAQKRFFPVAVRGMEFEPACLRKP